MTDGAAPAFSRINGLHRPFDTLQVLSWVLFLFFLIHFAAITEPILPFPINCILGPVYLACAVASIVFNVLSAHSNASDPGTATKLDDIKLACGDRPAGQTACYLCRAYVDRSSKHCRSCNKCVLGFDHHCKWLNNCVGILNYRTFFIFMTFTLITITYQLGILVYQFVGSFVDPDYYISRFHAVYGGPVLAFRICVGAAGLLAAATVALLGRLFVFHVTLAIRKKTTYEWILEQRERKRVRQEKKDFLRLGGALPGTELSPRDQRRIQPENPLTAAAQPPTLQPTQTDTEKASGGNSEEESARVLLISNEFTPDGHPFIIPRTTSSSSQPQQAHVTVGFSGKWDGALRYPRTSPEKVGTVAVLVAPRSDGDQSAPSAVDRSSSPDPSVFAPSVSVRTVDHDAAGHPPPIQYPQSSRGMDTMSLGMDSVGHPFSPVEMTVSRHRVIHEPVGQMCNPLDCSGTAEMEEQLGQTARSDPHPHFFAPDPRDPHV